MKKRVMSWILLFVLTFTALSPLLETVAVYADVVGAKDFNTTEKEINNDVEVDNPMLYTKDTIESQYDDGDPNTPNWITLSGIIAFEDVRGENDWKAKEQNFYNSVASCCDDNRRLLYSFYRRDTDGDNSVDTVVAYIVKDEQGKISFEYYFGAYKYGEEFKAGVLQSSSLFMFYFASNKMFYGDGADNDSIIIKKEDLLGNIKEGISSFVNENTPYETLVEVFDKLFIVGCDGEDAAIAYNILPAGISVNNGITIKLDNSSKDSKLYGYTIANEDDIIEKVNLAHTFKHKTADGIAQFRCIGKFKLDETFLVFGNTESFVEPGSALDGNESAEYIATIFSSVITTAARSADASDEGISVDISMFEGSIGMKNIALYYETEMNNITAKSDTSDKSIDELEEISSAETAYDVLTIVAQTSLTYNFFKYASESDSFESPEDISLASECTFLWNGGKSITGTNTYYFNYFSIDENLKKLFNSLSDYEKNSLIYIYTTQADIISKQFGCDLSLANCISEFYNSSTTAMIKDSYTEDDLSSIQIDGKLLEEYTQSIIDNFQDSPYHSETNARLNIAQFCYEAGIYSLNIAVTGTQNLSTGDVDDIGTVFSYNNADLNEKLSLAYGDNNFRIPPTLPTRIGILNGKENIVYSYNSYDLFVKFLNDIAIAFEVSNNSDLGVDGLYTANDIRAYLEENATANPDEFDFAGQPDGTIQMIRCIYSLCKFMDTVDIKPSDWTDTIKKYYELKDLVNKFENNPYITQGISEDATEEEPMAKFFNLKNQNMSNSWKTGYALSTLYIPMETNLYNADSITWLKDTDWVCDYYYKYGFYRKALYISTDNNCIINQFMTGEAPNTTVATLGDLLDYKRDIILYVDDNFYNAKDVNDVINKLDYEAASNTDTSRDSAKTDALGDAAAAAVFGVGGYAVNKVGEAIDDLFTLDPNSVLKTGSNKYYDQELATKCTKFGDSASSGGIDSYLLEEDTIFESLEDDEYSIKQSYAVNSAIYRNTDLYNEALKGISSDNAIWKSSPAAANLNGATDVEFREYINYIMLANLEDCMKSNTVATVDVDSPIFCDIFGNIVTETGIVIIPAATNATLYGDKWSPCSIGFATLYSQGNKIKISDCTNPEFREWITNRVEEEKDYYYAVDNGGSTTSHVEVDEDSTTPKRKVTLTEYKEGSYKNHEKGSGWFIMDGSDYYSLKTSVVSGGSFTATVLWDNLSKNNDYIKNAFYNKCFLSLGGTTAETVSDNADDRFFTHTLTNMVLEVLRGAPIEAIDYNVEGLDSLRKTSKLGVFGAYCLDGIIGLSADFINGWFANGQNSLVSMPDIKFMSGVEYIVLYAYKIMFAIGIVGLIVNLYFAATEGSIGFKSIGKFIATIMMFVIAITLVPDLMSWSYYEANKTLLNEEVSYLAMLNYTKDFDGTEIGVTKISSKESTTQLLLKIDDVSIDWWDVVDDVLFTNTHDTITELYEDQFDKSTLAAQEDSIVKGDSVYVDVSEIFNDTSISYYSSRNALSIYNDKSVDGNVASFIIPYYVILEQLVYNVNQYNADNEICSYTSKVAANGHIMTYDVISPFLTSSEFMEDGYDILGLHTLLSTGSNKIKISTPFEYSDISKMEMSMWWPQENTDRETLYTRICEVEDYARYYMEKNKDILGKVPDEVFLKVAALQIACKYNQVFHVAAGQSIDIQSLDIRDLARLIVASRKDVYKNYSYSLARFTYESGGFIACLLEAIYILIVFIMTIAKPLIIIGLIALLCMNVLLRKLIFDKQSRCVEGYLIGCGALCIVNYLSALSLKLALMIANTGVSTLVSFLLAIATQIVYILALIGVCKFVKKDWRNNGLNEFVMSVQRIQMSAKEFAGNLTGKFGGHGLFKPQFNFNHNSYKDMTFEQEQDVLDTMFGSKDGFKSVEHREETDRRREKSASDKHY